MAQMRIYISYEPTDDRKIYGDDCKVRVACGAYYQTREGCRILSETFVLLLLSLWNFEDGQIIMVSAGWMLLCAIILELRNSCH